MNSQVVKILSKQINHIISNLYVCNIKQDNTVVSMKLRYRWCIANRNYLHACYRKYSSSLMQASGNMIGKYCVSAAFECAWKNISFHIKLIFHTKPFSRTWILYMPILHTPFIGDEIHVTVSQLWDMIISLSWSIILRREICQCFPPKDILKYYNN